MVKRSNGLCKRPAKTRKLLLLAFVVVVVSSELGHTGHKNQMGRAGMQSCTSKDIKLASAIPSLSIESTACARSRQGGNGEKGEQQNSL